mgnify:CR=1 FL=1
MGRPSRKNEILQAALACFTEAGVDALADLAGEINASVENIGARRLHTVMERLMDELAFDAPDKAGTVLTIDKAYADGKLEKLAGDEDLSRYIL